MCGIVPIPNLPLYGAMSDGTIWSKKRKGPNRLAESKEWRKLKPRKDKRTGYWYLHLQVGNAEKTFRVHHLIAFTFLGPRPDGFEVNHKVGDKDNNAASNLEYTTYLENLSHAWDNDLITVGKPKLTQSQVDEIRALHARGIRQKDIAAEFGIGQPAVSDIVNYKTWNMKEGY